jgi:hypothetical protein
MSLDLKRKPLVITLLTIAAALSIETASATPVFFRQHTTGQNHLNGSRGYNDSKIRVTDTTFNDWSTVIFDMDASSTAAFTIVDRVMMFCVEPTQGVASPIQNQNYDLIPISSAGYTSRQVELFQLLWANAYQSTLNAATIGNISQAERVAAFQFIVWDIITDVPTAAAQQISLTQGIVQLNAGGNTTNSPNTSADGFAQATTWINALNGGTWTTTEPDLLVARSATSQDFLLDFATPEPGTYALMGGALLLLGLLRSRRARNGR